MMEVHHDLQLEPLLLLLTGEPFNTGRPTWIQTPEQTFGCEVYGLIATTYSLTQRCFISTCQAFGQPPSSPSIRSSKVRRENMVSGSTKWNLAPSRPLSSCYVTGWVLKEQLWSKSLLMPWLQSGVSVTAVVSWMWWCLAFSLATCKSAICCICDSQAVHWKTTEFVPVDLAQGET